MRVSGFLGPSNVSRAYASDAELTINLYPQRDNQGGTPKSDPILIKRPALRPWAKLPAGPVRGLYEVNGNAVAVGGNQFCILTANRTVQVVGEVAVDNSPATFAWNGQQGKQILIISGGLGYVYNTEFADFAPITAPDFPANVAGCEYLASVGIVRVKDSNLFYYSAENDFESWDALDFFATSLTADNKPGMIVNHGTLMLAGVNRTEFWGPTGETDDPFAPIQSAPTEQGTASGFSLARADNAVFLIQSDERGDRVVVRTNGYGFEVVSNPTVSYYLGQQAWWQIQQSIGWTTQIEGHPLYGIYIPNAPFSPIYDISTGVWFYWAHWDSLALVWRQLRVRNSIYCFGKHLVGSPLDGTIYEMTLEYESDAVIVP